MEGVALVPSLYASTRFRSKYKYTMYGAILAAGTLNILISVTAYTAYGTFTRSIVLMNLSYGLLSNSVQLLYSFGVLCSFIMRLFPVMEVLENTLAYGWLAQALSRTSED